MEQTVTFQRLWHLITKYRRLILISVCGGLVFSVIHSFMQPNIYKATATVMIKNDGNLNPSSPRIF